MLMKLSCTQGHKKLMVEENSSMSPWKKTAEIELRLMENSTTGDEARQKYVVVSRWLWFMLTVAVLVAK
jgi:hypothetical protein